MGAYPSIADGACTASYGELICLTADLTHILHAQGPVRPNPLENVVDFQKVIGGWPSVSIKLSSLWSLSSLTWLLLIVHSMHSRAIIPHAYVMEFLPSLRREHQHPRFPRPSAAPWPRLCISYLRWTRHATVGTKKTLCFSWPMLGIWTCSPKPAFHVLSTAHIAGRGECHSRRRGAVRLTSCSDTPLPLL
jgi:hypothetical protein